MLVKSWKQRRYDVYYTDSILCYKRYKIMIDNQPGLSVRHDVPFYVLTALADDSRL